MKKKSFIALTLMLTFLINAYCLKDFAEKTHYIVGFQENPPEMAAVLHVNFIKVMPEPKEAEKIVKQQLRIYGNKLIFHKKGEKYKNIIGSAWYTKGTPFGNYVKIKFDKDLAAYVWLDKTKKIVTFHNYISFLKKEKITKNLKTNTQIRFKK
ncbi:MAG: hypothetical protein Nk1A_4460 [Endomicrobiia bacterium]|nr:MAG: hypothetical protein Nk1A_4460 [Endomicrobiia bacterium]